MFFYAHYKAADAIFISGLPPDEYLSIHCQLLQTMKQLTKQIYFYFTPTLLPVYSHFTTSLSLTAKWQPGLIGSIVLQTLYPQCRKCRLKRGLFGPSNPLLHLINRMLVASCPCAIGKITKRVCCLAYCLCLSLIYQCFP